jgi:hypothetical protein
MKSHSQETKQTSIRRDGKAVSMKDVHSIQTGLSEPEDNMLSDVESFDEEDMYPANYNDESVGNSPASHSDGQSQSPLKGPVCLRLYITITYPDI